MHSFVSQPSKTAAPLAKCKFFQASSLHLADCAFASPMLANPVGRNFSLNVLLISLVSAVASLALTELL
jgi:hypothetical protein